jgi:hypothetical protein
MSDVMDVLRHAGRYSQLKRLRSADDPRVVTAHRDLVAAWLLMHFSEIMSGAPPLTGDQVESIAALRRVISDCVANLTTRTVRVFEVPRSLLSEFLKRPEARQVGVYYLFGSGEDETARCYIGQSGNVGVRLQQHTGTKDFWTRAMVAVSLTNEGTSTHSAYIEWLPLIRALAAGAVCSPEWQPDVLDSGPIF